MNKQDLAALLDLRSYPSSALMSRDESRRAAADGLVVVYGAFDDLMEFEGAIFDEVCVYDGGVAHLDAAGVLDRDQIDDGDDEAIADHVARMKSARSINGLWCKVPGFSWAFETDIPHETFTIMDDGAPFCRGIVFALADLGEVSKP